MESFKSEDPFTPGFGEVPPYLAGRVDQQVVFTKDLGKLSAGKSPLAMVLYGPRGMGKTTLLSWFENEVEQSEAKENPIRVVSVTPDRLKSSDSLWNALLPPPSLIKKGFNKIKKVSAGVGLYGATANAGVELSESSEGEFIDTLIKRNKQRPLILLMDEAHKMDADLCNQLLNTYQTVRKEMPFMLVLAGTPGLRNFLSNVGATFVERSEMISLGRLNAQSAADVIRKPFEEQGIEITNDALSFIVEDSQCYPYFLQVWGSSLWEEAKKENVMHITEEQVAVVKPDITIIKKDLYDERRRNLSSLGLRPIAVSIAKAFQDKKEMLEDMLLDIISKNLSIDTLNTQSNLERLQVFIDNDFVWKPFGSDYYEPGIPSFMTHILNKENELDIANTSSKEKDDQIPDHGR